LEWQVGLLSAGAQAAWVLWLIRSPAGVARKNYLLGTQAAHAGKYREALDFYRACLETFPRMLEIYPLLGDIHFKKGEIRQGLKAYETYLSQNPQDHVLRIKLLLILMGEERYEEFLTLLESLPGHLLQDYLLSILKAYALLKLAKPGQAARVLEEIPASEREGKGKDVPLHYLWGRIWLLKKEASKAREHLRQVIEARDDFMDAAKLLEQGR
jgi:tetratricopeptide (TPR) repeat protein